MVVRTAAELGLLIRARRQELGLDQQTLATRIGASRLWVIEFEKGKPRAEIGLVLRALTALELRVDVALEPVSSDLADIDAVVNASRKR